jgi:hypothetical protein
MIVVWLYYLYNFLKRDLYREDYRGGKEYGRTFSRRQMTDGSQARAHITANPACDICGSKGCEYVD